MCILSMLHLTMLAPQPQHDLPKVESSFLTRRLTSQLINTGIRMTRVGSHADGTLSAARKTEMQMGDKLRRSLALSS